MTEEEAPQILTPYGLAVELSKELNVKKNEMDHRTRIMALTGLMLYWVANEVNNLVLILDPSSGGDSELPVQDNPPTVPGKSPEEGSEG